MFKILTREAFALNRKHARIARYEYQLDPLGKRTGLEGRQCKPARTPALVRL